MNDTYYRTHDNWFFKKCFFYNLSKLSLPLGVFCFSCEIVEFYILYTDETWPFYVMINSFLIFCPQRLLESQVNSCWLQTRLSDFMYLKNCSSAALIFDLCFPSCGDFTFGKQIAWFHINSLTTFHSACLYTSCWN